MISSRNLIDLCKMQLDKTNSWNSDLETHLTKYIIIHICSECELEIKSMLRDRAVKCQDPALSSYLEARTDIRSLRISDLKGNILDKFGEGYSKIFSEKLNELDERVQSDYSSIVTTRGDAAHGGKINMSFNEVASAYKNVKKLLDLLSNVINGTYAAE